MRKTILIFGVLVLAISAAAQLQQPSVEMLGRHIYFDQRLSENQNMSCATCHAGEAGWAGPLSSVNAGPTIYEGSVPGMFGNRRPPAASYATLAPLFGLVSGEDFAGGNFYDGRATGWDLGNPAADQAQGPFLNPLEHALADPAEVVALVCTGHYAGMFMNVWGVEMCMEGNEEIAYDKIALSIMEFEDSAMVNSFSSKYDDYLNGLVDLSPQEMRGLRLFTGKAQCSVCHALAGQNGSPPLFTDWAYKNIGSPRNPENPFYTMPPEVNPDGWDYIDPGLAGFLETTEWAAMAASNLGKHKTPTLRNVDKRPSPGFVKAYGHNGYFKSLESIVHFYNTRDELPRCPDPLTTEADALAQNCWPEPEVSENLSTNAMGSLGLNAAEEAAIVAFMKTLTDDSTMGLRRRMGESPGPGPAGPPESGSSESGPSGPRGSGGKH